MRKGFTIIEILTVIIVLGIIAAIITANYNSQLKISKKNTFNQSMLSLIEQLEVYQLNNPRLNYLQAQDIDFSKMNLENKNTLTGKFKIENNFVILVDVTNGDWCANGNKNELEIVDGDCE